MLKFDNTHIFTGYLKQLLSTFNLPTCKIYTKEFADYYDKHKKEDPRILESFDTIEYVEDNGNKQKRTVTRVGYLRNNELYYYIWPYKQNKSELNHKSCCWKNTGTIFYNNNKKVHGLTRTLNSPGGIYDAKTHEYLGDYLRFIRDYYDINLMSMYNCFNNKICNNIDFVIEQTKTTPRICFNSGDSRYRIYAIPVKLFQNYTIAIDCNQEVELFCGLYNTTLDGSDKAKDLITKTYCRISRPFFKQPFLYNKLDVRFWNFELDTKFEGTASYPKLLNNAIISRFDIAAREQDLKLFIKVPAGNTSSISIIEGDFRNFNDFSYKPVVSDGKAFLNYRRNHTVINFGDKDDKQKGLDLNDNSSFKPISKLQLLELNTGESYPFADRLIEYLTDSAITPKDMIPDNIKRVQSVMEQNKHYFKISGLWEDKMRKIIYDCLFNTGPIEVEKQQDGTIKLVDARRGVYPRLGHVHKSTLYDVLGYVDRDAEKWYACWKLEDNAAVVKTNIQNADIYNGIFDI